jgi:GNAT superfamily N-acetyltransferase
MDIITIARASVDDARWLAKATLFAERAHTGKGIWDALLGQTCVDSDSQILECLHYVILSVPESHIHYSKFFVAKITANGRLLASCSGYGGETDHLTATFEGLKHASTIVLGWDSEKFSSRMNMLSFMKTDFPAWPPYQSSWWLEAIFCEPDFRSRGISCGLINTCLEEGRIRGYQRSMILVAIGNLPAKKLYIKIGFGNLYQNDIVDGEPARLISDGCLPVMGTSGFDILHKVL